MKVDDEYGAKLFDKATGSGVFAALRWRNDVLLQLEKRSDIRS